MIDIIAVPSGDGYMVECQKCGPLGWTPQGQVNQVAHDHLSDVHGVQIT